MQKLVVDNVTLTMLKYIMVANSNDRQMTNVIRYNHLSHEYAYKVRTCSIISIYPRIKQTRNIFCTDTCIKWNRCVKSLLVNLVVS